MRKLVFFLPFLLFMTLGLTLYFQLGKDTQALPSVLLGQKVPNFKLVSLVDNAVKTNGDLPDKAFLMNFWGTWCPACHVEHPFLNKLATQGVTILGVDYKDEQVKAERWLAEKGNPYSDVLMDEMGLFGLDMGVTGAPETFVVNAEGVLVYRHQGELNAQHWSIIKGYLE